MRPILPAILLLVVACSAPRPMTSASNDAMAEENDEQSATKGPRTVIVHEQAVELGAAPSTVAVPLANHRASLLDAARDPNRTLVLRVEGLSVTAPPNVNYEVWIGDAKEPSGMLSLYGVEESNGSFVSAVSIDEAAAKALSGDARELRVTFRPRGIVNASGREVIELHGKTRFARLTIVEE
jgi:hypothetical protein